MAAGIWSPEQADLLLAQGVINQDQYDRNLAMMGVDPASVPNDAQYTVTGAAPADPFAAGAASVGISPPPAAAPEPPQPPVDPFAAGAKAVGITPPPVEAPIDPSTVTGVTAYGVQPGPTTIPVNTTVRPITIDGSDSTASPSPSTAPGKIAAGGKGNPPSTGPDYSEDDVRAIKGLRPLTPREKRDPAYAKLVADYEAEHGQVDAAQLKLLEAKQKEKEIAAAAGQELADHQQATADAYESRRLQLDKERQQREAEMRAHLDGLNAEADDIAKTKIDNNRIFANQSTGDKVLGFFMALAGGLNTLGRNFYMEQLNKNIDNDIASQKADLENRRGVLAQKRGIYGDMLTLYRDHDAAEAASTAAMLQSSINQANAIKAKYAPAQSNAEFDGVIAGMQKQAEEEKFRARQIMWDKLQQQRAAAASAQQAAAIQAEGRRWELVKGDIEAARARVADARKEGRAPDPGDLRILNMKPEDFNGSQGDNNPLSGIPKDLKNEALKEMPLLARRESGEKAIDEYADTLDKWTPAESAKDLATPGGTVIGNKKRLLESRFGTLLAVTGEHSEGDYKRNVVPNFGSAADNVDQKADRIKALRERNRAANPTPILDNYHKTLSTPQSDSTPESDTQKKYGKYKVK